MPPSSIPTIDFSPFRGDDAQAKDALVKQIGDACRTYGFFQLVNHGIPEPLQKDLLSCSEELFSLPLEVKELYDKNIGRQYLNRGYERLRAQNFEKKEQGDLKEGYYFGVDLPADHPKVVAGKFSLGPNRYPTHVKDPKAFRSTIDTYIKLMRSLAENLLRVLCKTMDITDEWVSDFGETPIAVLRLLHYPPQPPDASELERGIGAHTDFGAVTILLQDMVGGLQVWDRTSSSWSDVEPKEGALVVNLGNLMMRWTNDMYISNLHRVINRTGRERYSVPFFFDGNPDFTVRCFENFKTQKSGSKYPPIMVSDWVSGRYADTYTTSHGKPLGELSTKEASAASSS